jgi:phospholipid/cholesterol/gamma-HCH transport system substrate-binding protein
MTDTAKGMDIGVGLFILLGLGSVLFLVTQSLGSNDLSTRDSYTLHAHFDHIGNLKVRAPVALAGVTIGRVSQISVDPEEFRAYVELQIDARFDQLPVDTFASIATSGIFGGKYIELSPGGDESVLQDDDEMELTQSAILLENLIGKFMLNSKGESTE